MPNKLLDAKRRLGQTNRKWTYDVGDKRRDHKWSKNEAGFDHVSKGISKGKCPKGIRPDLSEKLLNEGIPWGTGRTDYPERIYNVHEGVIYVAMPTEPGVSYHGFPWRGDTPKRDMPKSILKKLKDRAVEQGFKQEYKKWMNRYGR